MPVTAPAHPPHPVPARVAAAQADAVRAPSCHAPTIARFVTPLHRQTVASSGMCVGLAASGPTAPPPRTSRCAGSAGTGVPRSQATTRSAASAPAADAGGADELIALHRHLHGAAPDRVRQLSVRVIAGSSASC